MELFGLDAMTRYTLLQAESSLAFPAFQWRTGGVQAVWAVLFCLLLSVFQQYALKRTEIAFKSILMLFMRNCAKL